MRRIIGTLGATLSVVAGLAISTTPASGASTTVELTDFIIDPGASILQNDPVNAIDPEGL
jgi:hypothetical protein